MILRRFAWCLLALTVLSASPWEALAALVAQYGSESSVEMERPSPPEQAPGGDPCGDGCVCLCCSSHCVTVPPAIAVCRLVVANTGSAGIDLAEDLHPSELPLIIFHPPKSA